MDTLARCPECGADWLGEADACTTHFHRMLAWEWEHDLQDVHHPMVLCYHLQNPGLYSPEALAYAMRMLAAFVEEGVTALTKTLGFSLLTADRKQEQVARNIGVSIKPIKDFEPTSAKPSDVG
jgi:hypothetical protein